MGLDSTCLLEVRGILVHEIVSDLRTSRKSEWGGWRLQVGSALVEDRCKLSVTLPVVAVRFLLTV